MLEAEDRVVLADGVALRDGSLVDDVCRLTWPLNDAARLVVAPAGRRLADVAEAVAGAYGVPTEQAHADVLAFAWQLNRLGLANVDPGGGRARRALDWLRLAVRLAPAGSLPPLTVQRRRLDTSTGRRAAAGVVRGLAARAAVVTLLAAVLVAHVGLVAGRPALVAPAVVGLVAGGGLVLHEAAHAVALRGIPSALVLRGGRVSVVHAPVAPARRALVALAGPGVVAACGACLLAVAVATEGTLLVAAGGPAALHAVGLSVLAADGRAACGLS